MLDFYSIPEKRAICSPWFFDVFKGYKSGTSVWNELGAFRKSQYVKSFQLKSYIYVNMFTIKIQIKKTAKRFFFVRKMALHKMFAFRLCHKYSVATHFF